MSMMKSKRICLVMLATIVGSSGLAFAALYNHEARLAELAWCLAFYSSLAGIPAAAVLGVIEATGPTPKLRWPSALFVVSVMPLLL